MFFIKHMHQIYLYVLYKGNSFLFTAIEREKIEVL